MDSIEKSIEEAFSDRVVPIVICFDDNYSHAGGALIRSLIEHSDKERNYDILILEDGVCDTNRHRLKGLTRGLPNFSIRFLDVNGFPDLLGVHVRAHFSPATYARLFIPEVFQEQEKVLFIDSDTILLDDVGKLIDIELGGNLVAAVKDIIMEGFVSFHTPTDEHTGVMPAGRYLTEYLGLSDPDSYFQAGLLVFNLEAMRREKTFARLMQVMQEKRYWYLDQDIMNAVFQGRVHYLPMEWNVYHGNGETETFFSRLPEATYQRYLNARENPSLVHFAGGNKPWLDPSVDFADLYWQSLRDTPWYEQRLALAIKAWRREQANSSAPSVEQRIRGLAKTSLGSLLPVGSRRRNVAARCYLLMLSIGNRLKRH